jgi:hypothetical protein
MCFSLPIKLLGGRPAQLVCFHPARRGELLQGFLDELLAAALQFPKILPSLIACFLLFFIEQTLFH